MRDKETQIKADTGIVLHFNSSLYSGILSLQMNQFDKAIGELKRCLSIYPQHPEANYYIAAVYEKVGNRDLSLFHLQKGKESYVEGYRMNEDNIYYANYPRQVTLFEFNKELNK